MYSCQYAAWQSTDMLYYDAADDEKHSVCGACCQEAYGPPGGSKADALKLILTQAERHGFSVCKGPRDPQLDQPGAAIHGDSVSPVCGCRRCGRHGRCSVVLQQGQVVSGKAPTEKGAVP